MTIEIDHELGEREWENEQEITQRIVELIEKVVQDQYQPAQRPALRDVTPQGARLRHCHLQSQRKSRSRPGSGCVPSWQELSGVHPLLQWQRGSDATRQVGGRARYGRKAVGRAGRQDTTG